MADKFAPTKDQLHVLFKKAIITGFFGGMIWSVVWLSAYGLNMVKINPVVFWEQFFWGNFSFRHWYMYMAAIVLYSILSILFAVIYFAIFKRLFHWFVGFIYGLVIWTIFLIGIPYLFYQHLVIAEYSVETIIGLGCISISYGLFIGYTISFDYEMLRFKDRSEN